jgi:hypothetical protein
VSAPSNPPAFPNHPSIQIDGGPNVWIGMTLRDWFAGQALAMSTPDSPKSLAVWVYAVADAVLAERERNQ